MALPTRSEGLGKGASQANSRARNKARPWKTGNQRKKERQILIERSKLEKRRTRALKELGGEDNYTKQVLQMEAHASERRKRYTQPPAAEQANSGEDAVKAQPEGNEGGLQGLPSSDLPETAVSQSSDQLKPQTRRRRHSALQDALDAAEKRKQMIEAKEKEYQEGIARRDKKRRERKVYGRERFKFTRRGQPVMDTFITDALKKLQVAGPESALPGENSRGR